VRSLHLLLKLPPYVSPPLPFTHQRLGILGRVLNRLSRYLLGETIWLYVFGVLAFCLLLSVDRMFSWAKFFIDQEASPSAVGSIMLNSLPEFLHLAMPAAIAFGVLLATGRLAKDSELKAAYSSGVAPLRLLGAVLFFGLVVSGLTLLNNGYILPRSEFNKDAKIAEIYKTVPPAEMQRDVAYRTIDNGIFYAGKIQREEGMARNQAALSGILIRQQDSTTITAANGLWDSDKKLWTLTNAQTIKADGESIIQNEVTLDFDVRNPDQQLIQDKYLTLSDLWQRVQDQREVSGDVRKALYTFHQRIADALSALVFALIACVLGLELHGRSAGFGWTIVLILVFWVLWTLSQNLFEQGILSPIMAAYFSIILMGTVGAGLAWWRLR
jgi:lipopolysaccharide export system permease protein